MEMTFRGKVWVFGDDISTDHIIAGRYLGSTDVKVFAEHAMEAVDPDFARKVKPGDLLVGGANFGCGSSREQAPLALKALGIQAILAESFARIFYRNSINIGFPVVECPGIHGKVKEGDTVTMDLAAGTVALSSGENLRFSALPDHIQGILRAGGLVPKLRAELGKGSS